MLHLRHYKTQATFALTLLCAGMVGCKDLPSKGSYRGNLTVHQFTRLVEAEKLPVIVELSYGHHHLQADVFDAETHSALMPGLVFTQSHPDTIELKFLNFENQLSKTFILKKAKANSGQCYETQNTGDLVESSSVCFDHDNFNLNVHGPNRKDLYLYGTIFNAQKNLDLEPKQVLTVWQGVNRIVSKNYDAQESLQVLLRANETARRAYLNFLPHLSAGSALSLTDVAIGGWDNVGSPAAGLISFIFPGRWFKAKAATWNARAQEVATTLFRINLGTSVQSMSVAMGADKELRDELLTLQDKMTEVLKISEELAKQGRVDSNFIFTIEIALADLNVTYWQAQNKYIQDRMDLAKILAFENPDAVENILPEAETTSIEKIKVLGDNELEAEKQFYAEIALKNSFELRQLEYLHRAAVLTKKNMYVEWLDTDSSLDLGFKLIPQSKINQSLIESVEIKSEKTRQSLIVKAYNFVRDRNLLKMNFEIYKFSLVSRRERLDLLLGRFHEFANSTDLANSSVKLLAPSDLRGALKDVTSGLQGYFNTKAAVVIDQTELDRISLKGVYEKFVPQLSANEIPSELKYFEIK